MSYLGSKYNLEEEVGMPNASMASSAPAGGAAQGAAAGAAMKANPYLLGASFLLSYMEAKDKAFKEKQDKEHAIQNMYKEDQEQGLQALNNAWKSALR